MSDISITDDSKFANRTIEVSSDGSTTLFVPGIDEHYHSVHGAINESMHVFIDAGLKVVNSNNIKILEVGMGTGLNVLLTILNSDDKNIEYHTVEKYPLAGDIYSKLNYGRNETEQNILMKIHSSPWDVGVEIVPNFTLLKKECSIIDADISTNYNLVYFDAFAPEKQPEMWQLSIFQKIYDSMSPGGILVTYCAKGDVRRMMQSVGFEVVRIPGPPFKRHMTRAVKKV